MSGLPAHRSCTDPDCSLAGSRVVLRREASYRREVQTASWRYEFRVCTRCQMGFVHPVPPAEVMACLYTGEYAYYQAPGNHPTLEAGSIKFKLARLRYLPLQDPTAANRARSILAILAEVLARKTVTLTLGMPLAMPPSSRILDYGYGTGSWLLAMHQLGYSRLTGYDIAANAARGQELALRGIQVIPAGGISNLEPACFDCVRLEHVFEHLPDPLSALLQIHRLLRPEGLLLMTFPTIYPWLPIEELPSSPFLDYLQLPIHLAHHSVQSATRLVRAAGFQLAVLRITRRERFITLMARKVERGDGPAAPRATAAA
ncbi:MAG TPA: class I SAM-dependent methyltransferase [Thermoanaerobaculia bacterium]|nr:class I SAM-dependent methyltransferase [Thermoanaerobaculia bacterium]